MEIIAYVDINLYHPISPIFVDSINMSFAVRLWILSLLHSLSILWAEVLIRTGL